MADDRFSPYPPRRNEEAVLCGQDEGNGVTCTEPATIDALLQCACGRYWYSFCSPHWAKAKAQADVNGAAAACDECGYAMSYVGPLNPEEVTRCAVDGCKGELFWNQGADCHGDVLWDG